MSKRKKEDDARFFEEIAAHCKAMVDKNPTLKAALEKSMDAEKGMVTQAVDEIKGELGKYSPHVQQSFSFIPVEMTRMSPFFPMSRQEMSQRPYEKITVNNPWGTMEIQGERLSIYDESVLLAILKIALDNKTFNIATSFNKILTIMDVATGKKTYAAVLNALSRLTGTKVTITVKAKNGQGKVGLINTILAGVKYDKYSVKISINEYFGQMYLAGLVTSVDQIFRASLKGDVAKALYRFLIGQPEAYEIHIDKLCAAIMPDSQQPLFRNRNLIRRALKELQQKKFLRTAKITDKDHIVIRKNDFPGKIS